MKSSRAIIWAYLCIHQLILCPIAVYLWVRVYKLRHTLTMKKRLVNYQLGVGVFYLIYLVLAIPIRLLMTLSSTWRRTKKMGVVFVAFSVTIVFGAYLELLRAWLLLYGLKLSRGTTKKQWTELMNNGRADVEYSYSQSSEVKREELDDTRSSQGSETPAPRRKQSLDGDTHVNWYIAHVNTWGNWRWCLIRAAVCCGLHSTLMYSIYAAHFIGLVPARVADSLVFLLFSLLRVVNIIFYCKTPEVNDFIFLRIELKWAAVFQTLFLLSLTAAAAGSVMGASHGTFVVSHTFGIDLFIMLTFCLIFYLIPLWLRNNNLLSVFLDKEHSQTSEFSQMSRSRSHSSVPRTGTSSRARFGGRMKTMETIKRLISDNDGFQLFMAHLMTEFSSECLLSAVELAQFKLLVGGQLSKGACHELQPEVECFTKCPSRVRRMKVAELKFPRCVKQCGIVPKRLGTDAVAAALRICDALFAKYIAVDASLQINVSYTTRSRLRAAFQELHRDENDDNELLQGLAHLRRANDNYKPEEILHRVAHLWDDSIDEMLALMVDSCLRFTETDDYSAWEGAQKRSLRAASQ